MIEFGTGCASTAAASASHPNTQTTTARTMTDPPPPQLLIGIVGSAGANSSARGCARGAERAKLRACGGVRGARRARCKSCVNSHRAILRSGYLFSGGWIRNGIANPKRDARECAAERNELRNLAACSSAPRASSR
jgi:hypothetical protein